MPGLYFEEFHVGQMFKHFMRRTVTEADNLFISALTHNPAALHLDEEYMRESHYGARTVNSTFTLGLMVGISVGDTNLARLWPISGGMRCAFQPRSSTAIRSTLKARCLKFVKANRGLKTGLSSLPTAPIISAMNLLAVANDPR